MKITIFGPTGATGAILVDEALAKGHTVTAFVRDPVRLSLVHPQLRVVVGDVMVPETLDAAVAGQDAVICALGTMPESKRNRSRRQRGVPVCSIGTQNIILAMVRHKIRRIIVESSACVGESRRTGRFGAGHVVHLVLRDVMNDKERQETFVRDSTLDWTIVRPVRLSNNAPTGQIRFGEELNWGLASMVSRADVAAFMLDAILNDKTVGQALTLRN